MSADGTQPPPFQPRLPLYGPLDIENINEYLQRSKKQFISEFGKASSSSTSICDFNHLFTLGKGSFGIVNLIQRKVDNKYFAVKVFDKRKVLEFKELSHVLNEKRVLQSIDFPFAVRLKYCNKDSTNLYFIMPYISGGDMFTHLRKAKKFDERLSRFYAAQIVLALEYLQYMNVLYRDLKPENILIDHLGYVKLTDFGFAKVVESRTYTFCGTPQYLAPEVIGGQGYGRAVDWWGLGVLLYEMIAGRPPFRDKNNTTLFIRIMYDALMFTKHFSPTLQHLLKRLLQRDITRRFGNLKDGAGDVKKHEWFKTVDWLQLLNRRVSPPFIPRTSGAGDVSNFPEGKKPSTLLNVSDSEALEEAFKDF